MSIEDPVVEKDANVASDALSSSLAKSEARGASHFEDEASVDEKTDG
jgi:hypothetical protein